MKKSSIIYPAATVLIMALSLMTNGIPRMILAICALVSCIVPLAVKLLKRRRK